MNRFFLTAMCALMLVRALAWAGPLEDGVAAHQRGEYATAVSAFRAMAEEGNAAAQFNLGQMYRQAQGVPRDSVEAARWYHRAAAQGDSQSQYNLGVMYYNGQGVARNFAFSHMWLTLSAMSGAENAVRNRAMLVKQMTPEQIAEALRLARACKQRDFKDCD
jgi:TPR repeat protein